MQLRQFQRGVTMIELMVALVAGLIVSAAALALVASIIKSNSETVRATRLTSELRATAEVIARDLKRARSMQDPISNVSLSPLVTACNTIDVSTAGCVTYGYDCTSATAGTFNAVALASNKVYFDTASGAAPACPTTAKTKLSSDAVNITALTFTKTGTDAITIRITGQLVYQPTFSNSVSLATLTRSISQEVYVRSAQVQ
jgi:prepilin-type N-terminal cleavage/methylation domain-containing protein